MPRWTEAQVVKLAPDDASLKAARTLTRPGRWSEVGSTDILVWGKCQGSGKQPYQVSVDLAGPAFRCSCPSRKHPCKHSLALLLRWVAGNGSVSDEHGHEAPAWAQEKPTKATGADPAKPPDPVAQAKRLEDRLALMSTGLEDFGIWLGDLVRAGTAAARQQPYSWWDAAAARLVDSQLSGLAEQVRSMAGDVHSREDWADHLLAVCGRWWTATRAWTVRDSLDADAFADLRTYLGWAQATADVKAADSITGSFLVLGSHRTDDGRLQQQRTWLRDEQTGEVLLVLDFAVAGITRLAAPQLAGAVLTATVSRYPGNAPRRALFADEPMSAGTRYGLSGADSIRAALAAAGDRLASGPWSDRTAVVLGGVTLQTGDRPGVRDPAGDRLDLVDDAELWLLLALTGGHPTDLFGELEGGRFRPLTAAGDEGLVAV